VRVLLTVPSLAREFGGPVTKAAGLADALSKEGAEVRLIGAGNGDVGEGLPVLTTVHGTPIPRSLTRVWSAAARADVVHVLGYRDPVGTTAALAAAHARVPYLIEPCGMHRPRRRSIRAKRAFELMLGRRILGRAAMLVATSNLERHELIDDGVPPFRVRVRANGIIVPMDLPPRGLLRAKAGIPVDAPLVLAIGRIAHGKGLRDLVRAVSGQPFVHLLIAGPDSGDGALEELLRLSTNLEGRVHIDTVGLWGDEKFEALADADCVVQASLTESFGNAAAEAAAVGIPVVVSDTCGVAEILGPPAHRVVPTGKVVDLATALVEVLEGEARNAAIAAAPGIRAHLDWTKLARLQLDLYDEAIAGSPGRSPSTRT
jgi:glycosyltransferase involved in cell wall biosynthesis